MIYPPTRYLKILPKYDTTRKQKSNLLEFKYKYVSYRHINIRN